MRAFIAAATLNDSEKIIYVYTRGYAAEVTIFSSNDSEGYCVLPRWLMLCEICPTTGEK